LIKELSRDPATQRDFSTFFRGARDAARGLPGSDRERFLKAAGLPKGELDRAVLAKYDQQGPPARTTEVEGPAVLRTPRGYPLEFARSVIEATGCKGRDRSFDGAEATFGPGGRPTRIGLLQSEVSAPGCTEAAHILGASALATEGNPRVISILPQRPEFLACVVETSTRPQESPAEGGDSKVRSVLVGGTITEPRKVRNVAPTYPERAKADRIQGIVILEAEIAPSGCVSSVRVLRGADPALDLAAMDAVAGWRYTPTLLNGIPVPVIMTVTVNFRLN
jgi:TonB family protein